MRPQYQTIEDWCAGIIATFSIPLAMWIMFKG